MSRSKKTTDTDISVKVPTANSTAVMTELKLPGVIQVELTAEETRQLLRLLRAQHKMMKGYQTVYGSDRLVVYGLAKVFTVGKDKVFSAKLYSRERILWASLQQAASVKNRAAVRHYMEAISKVEAERKEWWLEITDLGRQLISDRRLQLKTNRNVSCQ